MRTTAVILLILPGCVPLHVPPVRDSTETVYLPPPITVEMRIETRTEREVVMDAIKRELAKAN